MSGGYFDYQQYRLRDIADSIENYLLGIELDDDDINDIVNDPWTDEEEKKYIKEHKRTLPNRYQYGEDALEEIRKGLDIIKQAEVYAQRIDWLLCGDDGEESFLERLKKDLDKLKTNT